MVSELDKAYRHCQMVARKHARNFYYAFRTLPLGKRRAIYAAYAYCRLCDDIADDDTPVERKREQFAQVRRSLSAALDGGPDADQGPEFQALADAASIFHIPHRYFHEIIEGVESDLVKTRFEDFGELRTYCYGVASVVGLICIEVFGYDDPRAAGYAIDMGIALQLTNILRDVKEDADRDRIYIPRDEMARFGYSESDLKAGVVNDRFRALMKFQADRARSYYASSRPLFEMLEPRSRVCPRVLHTAYGAILDRIEQSGFDVFSQRIGLSAAQKILITVRLWAGGLAPSVPVVRRLL